MSSILLKNVSCIGFGNPDIQDGMDLAINAQGQIETIDFNISETLYDRVFDLSSYLLSPGWIDLHTHIYYGVSNNKEKFWDVSNVNNELGFKPKDDASIFLK